MSNIDEKFFEGDKVIDETKAQTDKADDSAVSKMRQESKDLGFKSPFEDDEASKKEEGKETSQKDEDESDKKEESKPTRTSRAPIREVRESIKKGLEEKYEEKYGTKIKELEDKLSELSKGNLTKKETINLTDEVKKIATELNLKEDHLQKIVALSRLGIEDELKSVKSKLSEYESKTAQKTEDQLIEEEQAYFKEEFGEVEPSIKEKYPNATKEQMQSAFDKLDELAHTEKYENYDLDYILFKEQKEFDKLLFSPKKKGFESETTPEGEDEGEEKSIFDSTFKPSSYKDIERMDRKTKQFEESLPDTRFSLK